ncbi:hypothetical protein BWR19_15945 [Halomonas sp. 1513]|nr:hypothetical protein [Halomonas sp. 1513]APX94306.1 hypothetical protein BWR19_15945 [Halomonas sp. 1513]
MDDELKAIQSDLDSVLDRLAEYMGSDKLSTRVVEWDGATREDAAGVIFSYAGASGTAHTPMGLDGVITLFRLSRADNAKQEDEFVAAYGEDVGHLVSAIAALSDPDTVPDSYHLSTLGSAAYDFMEGSAKWFGQGQGMPLVRARKAKDGELAKPPLVIDGYLDKHRHSKLMAAMQVYFASRDLGKPIDDGLFEEVGERLGIKPGTLKAAYYSDSAKRSRRAHEIVEEITGKRIGCVDDEE